MAIDLIIWYLRSLQFCISIEKLGPKLIMIKKMVKSITWLNYTLARSKFYILDF